MRYCSLRTSGFVNPYIPRLSLAFGPGLNVIGAPDDATADRISEAFTLVFQGGSPSLTTSSVDPSTKTMPPTGTVEAVIELIDGQQVRLTRQQSADGTSALEAFDTLTKESATEQWDAAGYGILPCLSSNERTVLTALTSELRGLTPDVLAQLHSGPPEDAMTLNRWHVVVMVAAGLALGAIIWPTSYNIAVVAGTTLAVAIWLFFRRYVVENTELTYRSQLLHFGATDVTALEERLVRRRSLQRRYEAERQDSMTEKDDIPVVLQPFVVASPLCITGNDRLPLLLRDPTHDCAAEEAMTRVRAVTHVAERRQCIVFSRLDGFTHYLDALREPWTPVQMTVS